MCSQRRKKKDNGLLSMGIPGYFQNVALANLPENQKHFASIKYENITLLWRLDFLPLQHHL
jgi:hypothetical protein